MKVFTFLNVSRACVVHTKKLIFLTILLIIFNLSACKAFEFSPDTNSNLNRTIFRFHNLNVCRKNEFYDLDYFACGICNGDNKKLQPTADKFSCKCPDNYMTVYDATKTWPACINQCSFYAKEENVKGADTDGDKVCDAEKQPKAAEHCQFRYVNVTSRTESQGSNSANRLIYITTAALEQFPGVNCSICDLTYNFRYLDYCIVNALLKPYLHYNAFWQSTSVASTNLHYGDLKFVAFFCLALHNANACNQLANLCVQSHYSLDKNSPCIAFLLTQVSDVVMKYANNNGDQQPTLKPFLFYKKGKATAKLLATPLEGLKYELQRGNEKQRLHFLSTTFEMNGKLKRFGRFQLQHVNLCQLHQAAKEKGHDLVDGIGFAEFHSDTTCKLTLENLIDLARIYANDNFLNVYLNYSSRVGMDKMQNFVQQIPALIETLTPENQRSQPEEWQLVKRFQLFEVQPRYRLSDAHISTPSYEDKYKLQLYRTMRFVQKFELHYDIHAGNRISLPLIKLSYGHIDFAMNNISLQQLHTYQLRVTYTRVNEGSRRQLLMQLALPSFLFIALLATLFRANNTRRRRGSNVELCNISCFFEFVLRLISNVAHALFCAALLLIIVNSIEFLTQRSVHITLPLVKHPNALDSMVCLALVLKFIFLLVHMWRTSHYDLFLIDWERPRSCDNNHFNLKSNIETSSVCSSVRTYVAENNVSAWRILFTANEWIRLSTMQKSSTFFQAFAVLIGVQLVSNTSATFQDRSFRAFIIIFIYAFTYAAQFLVRCLLLNRIFGDPLQKFVDLCSLANISVFTLLDSSFGYYIHGRSPHGFADTDMSSMVMQLQREAQNMCGKRGLLSDSDKQAYIILPPKNLRIYLERLLVPLQRSCSISQSHYQKEIHTIDGNVERTSIAYVSVNRFFCAFIDHAIKDMDYIIKDRTFTEKLLDCEIDNYLTDNKGTFYIDNAFSFGRLSLLGNEIHLITFEFLLLLTTFLLTTNPIIATSFICIANMILQCLFRYWVRRNVSKRTLIDQRFLM